MLSSKPSGPSQPRLGEILIAKKIITPAQLDEALTYQKKNNIVLGEALIRLGLVTEDQLLRALSVQLNMPYVRLAEFKVPERVIKEVPARMVWEFKFMPVELQGDVLTIAVNNPLDMWPLQHIQTELRFNVNRVLAKKKDVEEMIQKYYGQGW